MIRTHCHSDVHVATVYMRTSISWKNERPMSISPKKGILEVGTEDPTTLWDAGLKLLPISRTSGKYPVQEYYGVKR